MQDSRIRMFSFVNEKKLCSFFLSKENRHVHDLKVFYSYIDTSGSHKVGYSLV